MDSQGRTVVVGGALPTKGALEAAMRKAGMMEPSREERQAELEKAFAGSIVTVNGRRWLIREAKTLEDALDCIAMAAVTGSVGCRDMLDETAMGGGVSVLADVVELNADGSERQPG